MSGYSENLYFGTPWWQDSHLCRLALAASVTLLCLVGLIMWPLADQGGSDRPSGFDVVSDRGVVEVDSVYGQPIKVVPTVDGRVTYQWEKPPAKLVDSKRTTHS